MPITLLLSLRLNAGMIAVALLVVVLWVGALWVTPPPDDEVLKLAVSMRPAAETFIMARNAGEIAENEVNFVEMNWPSAAMRAVGNRVVDAVVLSLDEVIRQRAQGYPLKIVLVTDVSRGGDALLARQDIESLAQLRGLRIGYEPRTAAEWLLSKALREGGLTMQDVQEVPLNPAEAEEVFKELRLDAVVTSDPWRHRLNKLKLNILYDSARPGAQITRVLAVHEEALHRHRQAVARLVQQHLRWSTRLLESEDMLVPILRREDVDRKRFEQSLSLLEMPDRAQNWRWLTREDSGLEQRLREVLDELAQDEPNLRGVDLSGLFDPSFVEVAK